MTRLYLPTAAELIDRLCIVQLKAIFIPENRVEYDKEIQLIMSDIDTILLEGNCRERIGSKAIHAIIMCAIANRVIWESESKARAGGDADDKNLKYTHAINGVRAAAKNVISDITRERKDLKIDCWAASLPPELGQWDVFK